MNIRYFSIIIPINNEAENLASLFSEVVSVMNNDFKEFEYEVIFVDDGSIDDSWEIIKDLKKTNKNIIGLKLNRRYGQSIALQAGFDKARGDLLITLDGDGQNNPSDIVRLYEKLNNSSYDVVAGRREKRKDRILIKILSRTGRFIRKVVLGDDIVDSGCSLRIYRKKAIQNIYLWGEMHRYMLHLIKSKGYKISQIPVEDRLRLHGTSKYGLDKAFRGFLDLFYIAFIYKYQARPLHFFGSLGMINSLFGMIFFSISVYQKIFMNESINRSGYFIVGMFLFQIGFMLFIFGIILDFLIRIYYETSYEKRFEIREEI